MASYNRLKQSGEWDVPSSVKAKGYVAGPLSAPPPRFPPQDTKNMKCWNCGKEGHLLPQCTAPRDQAKIDQACQSFRQANPRGNGQGGRGRPFPRRKKVDGKPMIRNKKGAYVLDQKRVREKKAALLKDLTKAFSAAQAPIAPAEAPVPTQAPSRAAVAVTPITTTARTIQGIMQQLL